MNSEKSPLFPAVSLTSTTVLPHRSGDARVSLGHGCPENNLAPQREGLARRVIWALSLWLWCHGLPAHAAVVHLAVASNFAKPIQVLVKDFEHTHPHQAKVSLGSTGKLFAQIQHGAPFDILMAADQERPRLLEQAALAVPESRRTYATGRLVLWSADPQRFATPTPINAWPRQAASPSASERAAIANPKLAPYGAAAHQVLERAGVWQTWKARLVTGENIAQTHQFVASGNAAIGLVARSQVMVGDRVVSGSGWAVPEAWHAPIAQDLVWLRRAQDNPAAAAWVRYISSPRATALIRTAGYGTPTETKRGRP